MSLVAYGASDDESDNDSQDEPVTNSSSTNVKSAGEDSLSTSKHGYEQENSTMSGIAAKLLLPPPKVSAGMNEAKRSSLASSLPKPKNPIINKTDILKDISKPLVPSDLNLDDEDEILEIEEEFVPLSMTKKNIQETNQTSEKQKSIGSLFSRMPSPWSWQSGISLGKKTSSADNMTEPGKGKLKQTVRISAPSSLQLDSDEEEESKPAAKKLKKSEGGSGLASLLPKPKHSVTVKANPNKPVEKLSNRTLIPYTLTKKPAKAATTSNKTKKISTKGKDSDEEDDGPVEFFSFSDKKQTKDTDLLAESIATGTKAQSANISVKSAPVLPPEVLTQVAATGALLSSSEETAVGEDSHENPAAYYRGTYSHGFPGVASVSHENYETEATAPYYGYQQQSYSSYDQNVGEDSYSYGGASYDPAYQQPQVTPSAPTDYNYSQTTSNYGYHATPSSPDTGVLDMEKLKRLQGKRNRKEQINIIDIDATDQRGDVELMATKLTSEEVQHRPSKKKGDMPTSQQRRKHQITYLAFQAKEKEFELRQQWASNRQTKRQTQSKYGF